MVVPSEEARAQTIRAACAAAEGKRDAERVRIPWKDSDLMATVIEIPLTSVVLNPRSHRIRAQLESAPMRELVQRDPFSDDAQRVIADLLRKTEDFEELRDNLKDVGQADPGVVTHTGLLVNANTRCVALRELGKRYIRVAVLPEDAIQEEIDRLELRLQMKRDFRRIYTFTNELLFIEELINLYKFTHREIALEMGWSSKSNKAALKRAEEQVQQYLRMLTVIREVQELSDGQLALTSFDDARQAIRELDDDYERLKKRNPVAAARLRDTRLVALLAGVGYREMREIDDTFLGDYLADALEEQESFKGRVDAILKEVISEEDEDVFGLEILETDDVATTPRELSATPLLMLLAATADQENVVLSGPSENNITIPRERFVGELKVAVDSAAEDARVDRQKGDRLQRPLLLARKALRNINSAEEAYEHVKADQNFDRAPLRKVLDELGRAQRALLGKLADEA